MKRGTCSHRVLVLRINRARGFAPSPVHSSSTRTRRQQVALFHFNNVLDQPRSANQIARWISSTLLYTIECLEKIVITQQGSVRGTEAYLCTELLWSWRLYHQAQWAMTIKCRFAQKNMNIQVEVENDIALLVCWSIAKCLMKSKWLWLFLLGQISTRSNGSSNFIRTS